MSGESFNIVSGASPPLPLQDPAQRRHLLRLWVAPPPPDRELPPAYLDWWGSITVGDRGDKRGQNTLTYCTPVDAC